MVDEAILHLGIKRMMMTMKTKMKVVAEVDGESASS